MNPVPIGNARWLDKLPGRPAMAIGLQLSVGYRIDQLDPHFARNCEIAARLERAVVSSDEIAVIPPVSGGAHLMIQLTRDPIDHHATITELVLQNRAAVPS